MNGPDQKSSLWMRMVKAPVHAWRALLAGFAITLMRLRNRVRKWRRLRIDYVVLPVGGSLPERSAPPRGFIERRLPLPEPPESMQRLNAKLKRIADAENVKGVLLIFQGFQTGFATLQNLRLSLLRLRRAGKEVVVYTPFLDTRHYYVATAADRIVAPPGAQFNVLGLQAEVLFLKDALQQIGVQLDVVQTSPYKTAFDMMQHADITPEYREQLEWLLDDQFDMITADMAEGRGISQDEMKRIIDQAPYFTEPAMERSLIDHVAYEDELSYLLADSNAAAAGSGLDESDREALDAIDHNGEQKASPMEGEERPQARLSTWPQSRKTLMEKYHRRTRPFIGVVSLEGLIVMGPSRRSPLDIPIPFLGGAAAGEQTLTNLLRKAEKLDNMAALILHVDSGGGDALASEIIGRQLKRIGEKMPVLVYMGNVAASGGYYVSAPAKYIMSQRATLTGSIGVIAARAAIQAFYDKVKVNRVTLQRGARANLYGDVAPLTEEERQILWDSVSYAYKDFKRTVAQGRGLPYEDLDPICEGRVWTGRQAEGLNLVDGHGDFVDAIQKAASLAGLDFDDISQVKVANLFGRQDKYVLPRPYEAVEEISGLILGEHVQELSGRPLMLMPLELTLH